VTVAAFPPACPNCGAPLGVVVEGRGQVFESLDGPVREADYRAAAARAGRAVERLPG